MKILALSTILLLSGFLLGCGNNSTEKKTSPKIEAVDTVETVEIETKFISPPIYGLDISYAAYDVPVNKGATFKFGSGSSIVFPSDAFVDKNGVLVKGDVQVLMREFANPLDFFVAGIPMTFDSSGTEYTFESSGMFEVIAQKDDAPVFVNPKRRPTIYAAAKNGNARDDLYFLDTIQQKWLLSPQKIVTNLAKESAAQDTLYFERPYDEPLMKELVKPIRANNERPVFAVEIPYVDFVPELQIFKNTAFEVDESEKNYNPNDADREWDRVELTKTRTKGVYYITFSTNARRVTYRVKPVYEGEDFTAALKIYEDLKRENEIKQRELQERQKLAEAEQKKYLKNLEKADAINRTFELENFGIWNCDRFITASTVQITATFIDGMNRPLELTNITLVSKEINGVFRFFDARIKVMPDTPQVIWGISKDKFYYFTFADFKKSKIEKQTSEYTFKMREHRADFKNYEELKNVLEL